MNLVGKVTAVFRDVDTGEITKVVEETNHIQDTFLYTLASTTNLGTTHQFGDILFVSDFNPGKQRRDYPVDIPNVRGGTNIDGVPPVEVIYDYEPGMHLGQFIQRFNAPVSDYTIHIAGVCRSIFNSVTAKNAQAVVWFSTPCVQTTTETLDLYYRIQLLFEDDWSVFDSNAYKLNKFDARMLAGYLFGEFTTYPLPNNFSSNGIPETKSNHRKIDDPNTTLLNSLGLGGTGHTMTVTGDTDYFCRRVKVTRDIQLVGKLVGYLSTYQSGHMPLIQKAVPPGSSPRQSVFGHRSTSTTPFYSAAHSQLGLGQLTVNGDAWTNPDFPKYVRMDITTQGAVGVGAYKFRQRNHFGFQGNTWANWGSPLYHTQGNNSHFTNDGFCWARDTDDSVLEANGATYLRRGAGSYAYPYQDNKMFVVWKDEFAVIDVLTGEGSAFTSATLVGADLTPRFVPTDISQVAVASNGDFYISCRNTGLYHLNAALDTLTVIDSTTTGLTGVTGCKAVCIGNAGRLWAYWGHATTPDIYYSDNGGSSWTPAGFSETFVDANPDLVIALQADVNNANGQLALLHYNEDESVDGTQTINLVWWDQLTTTSTVVGAIHGISRTISYPALPADYGLNFLWMHLVTCSPNNSFWGCVCVRPAHSNAEYPSYFTFGSASYTKLSNTNDIGNYMCVTQWVPDADGDDAILYVSARGQANGPNTNACMTVLYSQDGALEIGDSTNDGAINTIVGEDLICYIKDGVWLGYRSYEGATTLDYNNRNCYYLFCGVPDDTELDALPALKDEFYPEYGWNGAAWEKGHAGERTLHATAEEVVDGVTVAWDDLSGTAPFLDSDHYTFGLYDGIWLDGSTQFEFRWDLYSKPTTFGTDVEATTLPATTKVPNQLIATFPTDISTEFQDTVSLTVPADYQIYATGTGLEGDYNAGTRSINPVIDGSAQSFLPNQTYLPGTEVNNVQGYIQFDIYNNSSFHLEAYYGVSVFSKLGTTLDHDTIDHALHFDSVTPGNGVGTCTIRVVENGVQRATVDNIPYNATVTADAALMGRIVLLTNGSMLYSIKEPNGAWLDLYTSAPGSVTIQDFYFDCNIVPISSQGLQDITWNMLDTANPDYYLYLGDGIDKGVFHPYFQSTDPVSVKVTIDGTEAVHIGINDSDTVLPANSYSIFPSGGVIRYSASDVGKSVSAQYITVHHE